MTGGTSGGANKNCSRVSRPPAHISIATTATPPTFYTPQSTTLSAVDLTKNKLRLSSCRRMSFLQCAPVQIRLLMANGRLVYVHSDQLQDVQEAEIESNWDQIVDK